MGKGAKIPKPSEEALFFFTYRILVQVSKYQFNLIKYFTVNVPSKSSQKLVTSTVNQTKSSFNIKSYSDSESVPSENSKELLPFENSKEFVPLENSEESLSLENRK